MHKESPQISAQPITRREAIGLIAGIAAYHALRDGQIQYGPSRYGLYPLTVYPDMASLQNQSGRQALPAANDLDNVFNAIRPEFFESPDMTMAHRAGNNPDTIRRAVEEGAQVLDIDANEVGGKIYGEHGLVPQVNLWLLKVDLPLVIDEDEKKITFGRPRHTLSDLIAYIKSLSTPDRPLAATIELKRGRWKQRAISNVFDILQQHDMPAYIKVHGQRMYEDALSVQSRRNQEINTVRVIERAPENKNSAGIML